MRLAALLQMQNLRSPAAGHTALPSPIHAIDTVSPSYVGLCADRKSSSGAICKASDSIAQLPGVTVPPANLTKLQKFTQAPHGHLPAGLH
jgi:hypothetical protein